MQIPQGTTTKSDDFTRTLFTSYSKDGEKVVAYKEWQKSLHLYFQN